MNNLPPMTLFDYMVSSRENNMLKAFLPYIDRDFQPLLATYIKYTELLATIDLFNQGRDVFHLKSKQTDFTDIISSMLPYISPQEQEAFETINNIKNTMDMFETYKDMLSPDMMNAFSGFGDSEDSEDLENSNYSTEDSSNNSSNIANDINESDSMSDMLSSMLSPEQQLMFEQLSGMMNNS